MKVLSLLQPWASLIALGAKKIETRSWKTLYRGPILIHASARFPREAKELCETEPFKSALGWNPQLPLGAIVCRAKLLDIKSTNDLVPTLGEKERAFGDYGSGRFGWLLEDVRPLKPINAKGALYLWNFPDERLPKEAIL